MTATPFVRHKSPSWYESSARDRARLLLDVGTFEEFLGPEAREMSPHLSIFDLPRQFDDGIVVGTGKLAGKPVFVAAQEGRFMGGAFGEVHGAKLTGLLRAAHALKRDVFIRKPGIVPLDRCIRISCGRDEDLALLAEALSASVADARKEPAAAG